LFESIEWAVWGSLSRVDNPRADGVINRAAGKNCMVRLSFQTAGHDWVVLRSRKHDEWGTGLRWWFDGKEMTKHDSRETQEELADALPMSRQVYRYAVQVGQGMPDKFLSLSETAKQELLSEIIDLSLYDRAQEASSGFVAEIDTKLRAEQEVYALAFTNAEAFESQAIAAQAELDAFSTRTDDPEVAIRAIDDSIPPLQAKTKDVGERIVAIEEEWRGTHSKAEELRKKIDESRARLDAWVEEERKRIFATVDEAGAAHDDEIAKAEAQDKESAEKWRAYLAELGEAKRGPEGEVKRLEGEIGPVSRELETLKAKPTHCPTCGKPLDTYDLGPKMHELQTTLSGLDKELGEAKLRLDAKKAEYSQQQVNALESSEKWIAYIKNLRAAKAAAIQEAKTVAEAAFERVRGTQGATLQEDLDAYQAMQNTIANCQKRHQYAKAESSEIERDAKNLMEKREGLRLAAQQRSQQRAQLQERVSYARKSAGEQMALAKAREDSIKELEKQKKHYGFWKQSIPNLRASAMTQILGYLNERIAHYMAVFSGGVMGMQLVQVPYGKKSKIRVDLWTPGGSYEMSSGGERRRVDLSIYLALSNLLQATSGYTCNLTTADEIMDGLSPQGVAKFLDVLRQRAENGHCVYVMSHNPAVLQTFSFDSVWTVERRNGKAIVS
jgi:DNA repair exonuclease SbcCD ATPase subunit